MLSEIFYWLLNMSISATIVGIIILILGKIRKIPRRIVCVLWVIPFLRMWIPVGINSKFSLMTFISRYTTKTVTVYEKIPELTATNCVMAADSYFPMTYKINILEDIFRIAFIVWLVVAAVLIFTTFLLYRITMSELKDAKHIRGNIYLSDKVNSPAAYGIIREKIIMPKMYKDDDLRFILLHEKTHIVRKDNLWRVVGIVTACVHWFNPLSWLFLKDFLASLEYACDEAVLKICGEEEKKNYAMTLVNCVQSKSLYASAFGGAKVRVRIENILSYKKLSLLSIIGFGLLAIMIGYVLLTNGA